MFKIRCCSTCAFYGGKGICNFMAPIKIPSDPDSHFCVYHEYDEDIPDKSIPYKIPCKALGDHILIYRIQDSVKIPIQTMGIKDSVLSSSVFRGTLNPMNVPETYNAYFDRDFVMYAVRKDVSDEN